MRQLHRQSTACRSASVQFAFCDVVYVLDNLQYRALPSPGPFPSFVAAPGSSKKETDPHWYAEEAIEVQIIGFINRVRSAPITMGLRILLAESDTCGQLD